MLQRKEAFLTYLAIQGIEPTNNAAEQALRQSVIQRKVSLASGPPAKLTAAAACSRSPPACGNRDGISGSLTSRAELPIIALA